MFIKIILTVIFCVMFILGCSASPIPKNIEFLHKRAREDYLAIRDVAKAGDIIFRMGTQPVLGGLIDFSKETARMANSDFSHACIVIQADNEGVGVSAGLMVADTSVYGIERRFFKDWHIEGTENLVIKRLKPDYQFLVPQVLNTINLLLDQDVLYNESFEYNNKTFYCSQVVDYAFRVNGYPLSDLVRIKDFPNYGFIFHGLGCLIGGVDPNVEVALPGNDEIGLFSSPMLDTVVDLRRKK